MHYDHPILMLQQMIWHEGYHHGQIKLVLKMGGHAISDEEAPGLSPGAYGCARREVNHEYELRP